MLLHLLAYQVLHAGLYLLAAATRTGWSLRRFREWVLSVGARVVLHARRATLVIAAAAARHWAMPWPRFDHVTWAGT